jgi:hypothetical protein
VGYFEARARIQKKQGDARGALRDLVDASAIAERALPTNHPQTAGVWILRGETLLLLKRRREAIPLLKAGIATLEGREASRELVARARVSLSTALRASQIHRGAARRASLKRGWD